MSFSEDYLNDNYETNFDEEEVKSKINICRGHIDSGNTFAHIDLIEDVIQYCMEYDFIDDGLYLADSLLKVVPYNSEAWQYKGILLNNTFKFDEAYHCFDNSLALNPNDIETYINKSIAEDNLGMFSEAVASLLKALEIEPDDE